jgi:hypothetical protein
MHPNVGNHHKLLPLVIFRRKTVTKDKLLPGITVRVQEIW